MYIGYLKKIFAMKLHEVCEPAGPVGTYRSRVVCSMSQKDDHKLSLVKLWDTVDSQSTCDRYDEIPHNLHAAIYMLLHEF